MQTLTKALRQNKGLGEPLPVVYPSMAEHEWLIRRAQVTLIAAAPNIGKSALALDIARKLGEPTLYISADTDPFTTILRAAAGITGDNMRVIEDAFKNGAGGYYEEMLAELDSIRFTFEASPTLEDIDLEVRAFVEVYGEPPAIIVVDNLINVQADEGDEFAGLRSISRAMQALARNTGAAVICLHHVTGKYEDGVEPPPLEALHGKISKFPEAIYTLGRQGQFLGIACVKQQSGPADRMAGTAIWLTVDIGRMSFEDPHALPE